MCISSRRLFWTGEPGVAAAGTSARSFISGPTVSWRVQGGGKGAGTGPPPAFFTRDVIARFIVAVIAPLAAVNS